MIGSLSDASFALTKVSFVTIVEPDAGVITNPEFGGAALPDPQLRYLVFVLLSITLATPSEPGVVLPAGQIRIGSDGAVISYLIVLAPARGASFSEVTLIVLFNVFVEEPSRRVILIYLTAVGFSDVV